MKLRWFNRKGKFFLPSSLSGWILLLAAVYVLIVFFTSSGEKE